MIPSHTVRSLLFFFTTLSHVPYDNQEEDCPSNKESRSEKSGQGDKERCGKGSKSIPCTQRGSFDESCEPEA